MKALLTKQKMINKVILIPEYKIKPNPYQPRKVFDGEKIEQLATSIAQYGLLQPITVLPMEDGNYQLVAGERRLLACRRLKMQEVPAILTSMDEERSSALALVENIQRCDLNYFEEAMAIQKLMKMVGYTQQAVAKKLGKNQSTVANKLRLLTLTPEQQQLCTASHLSERHARAALRLPEGRRTAALEKMARDKMSVRQADRLVDQMLAAPNGPSPCRRTIPMVRDVRFFVNTLQHAVDLMTQKGIAATTRCDKHDGCLEYIVRIPVSSDGTAGKVENGAKEEEGEFEVKV